MCGIAPRQVTMAYGSVCGGTMKTQTANDSKTERIT